MTKEHQTQTSVRTQCQTKESCLENTLTGLRFANSKYKKLSLSEFEKIANSVDPEIIDEDLALIIDLLIGLTESINVCKRTNPGSEFYNYHALRIKHLNKALRKFAWFEELKEKQSYLFSYDESRID
jgi:hypothetical protein